MPINVGQSALSMGYMRGERKMCLRVTGCHSHMSMSRVTTASGAESCMTCMHVIMIT
jgi:hypothetical protein